MTESILIKLRNRTCGVPWAWSLQDTHLFAGTVMENIRYGRLDATDEECIAAAKLANADGFIRRLPDGYQTILTGDGANLSQGATAASRHCQSRYGGSPVLILDEATSSIDTRAEALVQDGMDRLMKGRTTFVIAHRLSTVKTPTVLWSWNTGRIIEQGSHEQLLEEKAGIISCIRGMPLAPRNDPCG